MVLGIYLEQLGQLEQLEIYNMSHILLLLLLTSTITAAGQLLFKYGSRALKLLPPETSWLEKITHVFFQPSVLLGIFLYAGGVLIWLVVLAKTELSFAYPVNVALSILFTSVIGWLIFNEALSALKIIGIILIIAGIFALVWQS